MDFADVVDQGKQSPLDIYLGFGTQSEAVQPLLNADVGKDRLDNPQASGIDLLTLRGVYLCFHFIEQVRCLLIDPDGEIPAR